MLAMMAISPMTQPASKLVALVSRSLPLECVIPLTLLFIATESCMERTMVQTETLDKNPFPVAKMHLTVSKKREKTEKSMRAQY